MKSDGVVPWTGKHRLLAWTLFAIFLVGFVLFFVSYVGNSWYVVPEMNRTYPPENRTYKPGYPVDPINFGLFYMCFRGHCKYDLRQDYFIVSLIPQMLSITWAYQQYRTVCMVIESVAAGFCFFTLCAYLIFLSGFSISHYAGYVTGGLEIIAGVIALIGVIIFGKQFRGSTTTLPFGWSFGLMIIAFIILILNGIATVAATIPIHRRLSGGGSMQMLSTSASAEDSRLMSRRS